MGAPRRERAARELFSAADLLSQAGVRPQADHYDRIFELRPGNVHSADGWEEVLKPVIVFRADAAFALPTLYVTLETAGYFSAIRLPKDATMQERIADLMRRPVGRPPNEVRRVYGDFEYQAGSWEKPRGVLAKIDWHPGELLPRVGFLVTNLPLDPEQVFAFYKQRGTTEHHIKEGKIALKWHDRYWLDRVLAVADAPLAG